jgi:hypothetical protein
MGLGLGKGNFVLYSDKELVEKLKEMTRVK